MTVPQIHDARKRGEVNVFISIHVSDNTVFRGLDEYRGRGDGGRRDEGISLL
jgi:hypothetical protein